MRLTHIYITILRSISLKMRTLLDRCNGLQRQDLSEVLRNLNQK